MTVRVEQVGKFFEITDKTESQFSYVCKINMWTNETVSNIVPVLFVDLDNNDKFSYICIPVNRDKSSGIKLFKDGWSYTNNESKINSIQNKIVNYLNKDVECDADKSWIIVYDNLT